MEEQLAALHKLFIEDRQSYELQLKQKEEDISKLRNDFENEKESAEERILTLVERQRMLSPVTPVQEYSEEQLVCGGNKRLVSSGEGVGGQEENKALGNRDDCGKVDLENNEGSGLAEYKIKQLEEELVEQKEVIRELKAYIGEILETILITNPEILQRK